MKLHLKAIQHHPYDVVHKDESKAENFDEAEDAPAIPGEPCLVPCMDVFLMDKFEITYEWKYI